MNTQVFSTTRFMPTLRFALASLLVLAGLSSEVLHAQARRGSIYNPNRGPIGLVANKSARRVGDLVTIIINETQDIKNDEKADLKKGSDLKYELLNFDLKPNAFNVLPGFESGRSDNFAGTAKYEKKGQFTARLTAVVMDVLPSGNMVVRGRREIRIDQERKVIEFSGVVRKYDVRADNTIQSELVADARVNYSGSGPMTKSTNRTGLGNWLRNAVAWLWPF
ncbi:MAG: flagellar L-ring protein precursor FlgH [Planctomycetota bacterium]|jgi:flagellar L-ring protein precursor FlgH